MLHGCCVLCGCCGAKRLLLDAAGYVNVCYMGVVGYMVVAGQSG